RVGVHASHTTDVARGLYREILLRGAGNLARQADHAVFGADVDFQAVEVVADQIAGLDLAGDPAVADGRPGLVGAVLCLGRGGAGCTDAEQVVDVADAIGVGRQTSGQFLGFRAARLAL